MGEPKSEWIVVDPGELDLKAGSTLRGIDIVVFVSPYDLPQGVRGYYSNDKKRFVIEFDYIGQEDTTSAKDGENVSFVLGRVSRRLYSVIVDVNKLELDAVTLKLHVTNAIDKLGSRPEAGKALGRESYKLAKEVVARKGTQIFEAATA